MDGLDLALTVFRYEEGVWSFEIVNSTTYSYPEEIYTRLKSATKSSPQIQHQIDIDFGVWIARQAHDFLNGEKVDLFAIHGHTLIHSPEQGVSWQLGSGRKIADSTGILTISNFRTEDIGLGGQGAPLVPLGDFLLFGEYDACLNLGGIANLSIKDLKTAGDICPCNQVLNYYANRLGHVYDAEGSLARVGHLDLEFYKAVESQNYFDLPFPKSLPNDFLSVDLLDTVEALTGLRTYVDFISDQVAKTLDQINTSKPRLLITGGGAFNSFLVEQIKSRLPAWQVILPSIDIVCQKEALIFGFLGLKKLLGEINVLSSVTGALSDTSSGVIHDPK